MKTKRTSEDIQKLLYEGSFVVIKDDRGNFCTIAPIKASREQWIACGFYPNLQDAKSGYFGQLINEEAFRLREYEVVDVFRGTGYKKGLLNN